MNTEPSHPLRRDARQEPESSKNDLQFPTPHNSGVSPTLENADVAAGFTREDELRMHRAPELVAREYFFQKLLADIPIEELWNKIETCEADERADVVLLKALVNKGEEYLKKLQSQGIVTPPDTRRDIFNLFMLPGACTVVLHAAHENAERISPKDAAIIGYGLVLTDQRYIYDLDEIPKEFRDRPEQDLCRHIRLFTDDIAQDFGPYGLAVDKIVRKIFQVCGDRPVLGKCVTGPEKFAQFWATQALHLRGYEPIDQEFTETMYTEDVQHEVTLRWMVHPPVSKDGLEQAKKLREELQKLDEPTQREIVAPSVYFPAAGALIGFVAEDPGRGAWDLSRIYPDNFVIAANLVKDVAQSHGLRKKEFSGKANFATTADFSGVADQIFDGLFVNRSLSRAFETGRDCFLRRLSEIVKQDGRLIIQDELDLFGEDAETGLSVLSKDLQKVGFRVASWALMPGESAARSTFTLIAEKISKQSGSKIETLNSEVTQNPQFLRTRTFDKLESDGEISSWEIIERPNLTLTLVPHFNSNGVPYVFVRDSYPRPIVVDDTRKFLDGGYVSGYLTEPISAIVPGLKPDQIELAKDSAVQILKDRVEIEHPPGKGFGNFVRYFPTARTANEVVFSLEVKIDPRMKDIKVERQHFSGLSSDGVLKAVDVRQYIRGCHTGIHHDSRIERMGYPLLLREHIPLGPWFGDAINLSDQQATDIPIAQADSVLNASFSEAASTGSSFFETTTDASKAPSRYLEIHTSEFVERDASGRVLATTSRESIRRSSVADPKLSDNIMPIIPVIVVRGEDGQRKVYYGLGHQTLPPVDPGKKDLKVAGIPVLDVPEYCTTLEEAQQYAKQFLKDELNLKVLQIGKLGGKFFTSPGVGPEVAYPHFVEVDASALKDSSFDCEWVEANDLRAHAENITEGNTLTCFYRFEHAIGNIA